MTTFIITIYNGSGAKVYNDMVIAKDGSEALKMIIDNITLYDGDTIEINEG